MCKSLRQNKLEDELEDERLNNRIQSFPEYIHLRDTEIRRCIRPKDRECQVMERPYGEAVFSQ